MSKGTILRALALTAALAGPVASNAFGGDVLHVPSQYPTIQSASSAAGPGDTVLVADGVYSGPGNRSLDFGTDGILMRSENGAESCIIDGLGTHPAFHFFSTHAGVVEGFTIRNCSNDTGGAVEFHHGAEPTFRRCVFADNQASFAGGAILVWHAGRIRLIECVFLRNRANYGGAVTLASGTLAAEIVNCTFLENHATSDGGALYLGVSFPVWGSLFARNTAGTAGGAIHVGPVTSGAPAIRSSTLAFNEAGSFGGGVACVGTASVDLSDSILWGDAAPRGPEIALLTDPEWGGATLALGHCDLQGGPDAIYRETGSSVMLGLGIIDLDPLFLDPSQGDYHIAPDSPARDAGNPAPPLFPSKFDIDLEPRFFPPRLDMGADEVLELAGVR